MNHASKGTMLARTRAPKGKARMQTAMAARCNEARQAVSSMCPTGRLSSPREAMAAMNQVKRIRVSDPTATPVNSALKRLQGVVLDNHQDPCVSVTTAIEAPTMLAKKPIS